MARALVWGGSAVVAAALLLAGALRPLNTPPTLQQRALAIAAQLRCPVCAGESAATSDVPQAQAMRQQIAADLRAGMDQRQILGQFVEQYGQWILYRPPGRGWMALLWAVPAGAVAAAAVVLGRQAAVRRAGRSAGSAETPAAPAADLPGGVEASLRRWI